MSTLADIVTGILEYIDLREGVIMNTLHNRACYYEHKESEVVRQKVVKTAYNIDECMQQLEEYAKKMSGMQTQGSGQGTF